MKKVLTSVALIAMFTAGSAIASTSVQKDYMGGGTDIESATSWHSQHQVTVDSANLPSNEGMPGLYTGSK